MRKVLVTGVTGSVGQVLAASLQGAGFAVRAASRRPLTLGTYTETAIMPAPDAAPAAFLALVDGVDHVVHAAALTNLDKNTSEEEYMAANAGLSAALALASSKVVPGRFILLSSIRAVAGSGDGRIINDNIAPAPSDAYGRSKRAAEIAVDEAYNLADGLERLAILRPAPIYGKGMKGGLAGMLRLADTAAPLPFGAFHNRRSLLSVDSLADAVLHLLQVAQAIHPPFIVSDSAPVDIAAIFRAFRRGFGRPTRLIDVPPGLIKSLARLAGRGEAWKRLFANEICDPTALAVTGWQPADSAERLEKLARALKNGR